MYKFPIQLPSNLNLTVVQPFHVRTPVDSSKALSIQTTDHIGVDVVCGTDEQTWGKECVWPFPWPGTVWESLVDSEFGANKHAHAQIDTVDPATGIQYSLIYLHLSSVTRTKSATDSQVIVYQQGDVIGKIGNNGAVNPLPTPQHPLWGTHLHLGLGVKNVGETNYIMTDPQTLFDISNPFRTVFKFNKNLAFGTFDPDVIELQKRLGVSPTFMGFGTKTLAAVKGYQLMHNIPSTGYFGPQTRASLNA